MCVHQTGGSTRKSRKSMKKLQALLEEEKQSPENLEKKEVHQAFQKEMDKFMNPEDSKMSKEEQMEYDEWKDIMMDEDRKEHEEDEVIQEQVNWLKFVPEHEYEGFIYNDSFSTKRSIKKE